MKFVDFRSKIPHYSYMMGKDIHKSEVYLVNGDSKVIKPSNPLLSLYLKLLFSRKNRIIKKMLNNSWYKYVDPIIQEKDKTDLCFIVTITELLYYKLDFVSYLHKNYNGKVVLVLGDIVDTFADKINLEDIRKRVDLICTYNKVDSEKYNIPLHPAMVFDFPVKTQKSFSEKTTDVIFVGRDKGRGKMIYDLFNKYSSLGLSCDFYIVGDDAENRFDGLKYCDYMAYDELFEKVKEAKCILNILQPGAIGITLRENEAYNLGSYLITNNNSPELKDVFYDDQVIKIEDVDAEFVKKVKSRTEPFHKKGNPYSLDIFYQWICEKVHE